MGISLIPHLLVREEADRICVMAHPRRSKTNCSPNMLPWLKIPVHRLPVNGWIKEDAKLGNEELPSCDNVCGKTAYRPTLGSRCRRAGRRRQAIPDRVESVVMRSNCSWPFG